MTIDIAELDQFTLAYLECALWAETDNADESGGDPLDKNYGIEDFSQESLAEAVRECKRFREQYAGLLSKIAYDEDADSDQMAGYDFWLTRNGHGVGFWDRNFGTVGYDLAKAAEGFGTVHVYVGDDGSLYIE